MACRDIQLHLLNSDTKFLQLFLHRLAWCLQHLDRSYSPTWCRQHPHSWDQADPALQAILSFPSLQHHCLSPLPSLSFFPLSPGLCLSPLPSLSLPLTPARVFQPPGGAALGDGLTGATPSDGPEWCGPATLPMPPGRPFYPGPVPRSVSLQEQHFQQSGQT